MLILTYADQDALALEVDIGDRELVGERHDYDVSTIVAAGSAELFYSFKTSIEQAKMLVSSSEIRENLKSTHVLTGGM